MPAVSFDCGFNAVDFAAMMSQPAGQFYIDLRNATLMDVIDEYIKFREHTRPDFAKQWHTTRRYLGRLQFLSPRPIMPIDVGETFYPFLIQCMLEIGCATTTVEHTLSQIRSAVEFGSRYGAQISPTYDKIFFRGRTKTKTVLTYSELCHIYFFDIKTLKHEDGSPYRSDWYRTTELVRDMLIFSTIFGQRYSDAVRITPQNFDDSRFTITQQKTGNRVAFDVLDYAFDQRIARNLLRKYNYTSPYTADISNYNKRVSILLRGIGGEFMGDVVTEEKIQGRIVRTVMPRHAAVTSHTARRTAITYWASKGRTLTWIKKMSGHSDLRSLEKYIIDEEDD